MSGAEILVTVVVGLVVNELCDVSPWIARKLVRWSARRRYTDSSRAEIRAEELARLIDDRPGKLLKLLTALGFTAVAVAAATTRTITDHRRRSAADIMLWAYGLVGVLAAGLGYGLAAGLAGGLAGGLGTGLAYGLVVGLAVGLAAGLVVGLGYGLAGGLAYGLGAGLGTGPAYGLAAGLAGGLAGGLGTGLGYGLGYGLRKGLARFRVGRGAR